jgi:hypothetical protein
VAVTPARAVEIIRELLAAQPEVTHLYWNPALPGLPASEYYASLELFAREVAPSFRE